MYQTGETEPVQKSSLHKEYSMARFTLRTRVFNYRFSNSSTIIEES